MQKINSVFNLPIYLCIFSKDSYFFMLGTRTLRRTLQVSWFNFHALVHCCTSGVTKTLYHVSYTIQSVYSARHSPDALNNILSQLFKKSLYVLYGPGWHSRYSDSLRAGRSGYRILVGARFSALVQTCRGASYTMDTGSFPGVKLPEINLYSLWGLSCPVLWWIFTI